jgi:AraC-like DNA-binding protein
MPSFVVGDGYAVYRGPTGDGHLHRHAAFQIAIGVDGDAVIIDGDGGEYRGAAVVVAPMVRHCLQAAAEVTTYFIEPQSSFADRLRRDCRGGIAAAPELRGLQETDIQPESSAAVDNRLIEAMAMLAAADVALTEVAERVGLSAPRLRSLARTQIGMPLTRWRVWARLRRAAEAVGDGMSLAQAAAAAGFADQAHLTRQMREMMGLTPASVLPLLDGRLVGDVDRD